MTIVAFTISFVFFFYCLKPSFAANESSLLKFIIEASFSNACDEQDEDSYVVEFLRNSSLLGNNEQELDNESAIEIQTEESIRDGGRGCGRGRGRDRGRGRGNSYDHNNQNTIELPPLPSFDTFQHDKPLHKFTINLPKEYQTYSLSPYLIFGLFFSSEQLKIIVKNTNVYAYSKNVGEERK